MIVCLGTTPVYQRSMIFGRVHVNEVNRAAAVHDYASGKSVNVARVLHTLGEEAVACGFVGRGDWGDALLADLDRAGIRHDFVRVAAPARQCVTVIDREAGIATELVEESRPVGGEDWAELMRRLAAMQPAARGCVFSGSLPPGASDGFYAAALRLFESRPRPMIVDTRKGPLREALRVPRVVAKLNRDELAETAGAMPEGDEGLRAAMRGLAPRGGGLVITSGAEGAVAHDGQAFWHVRPPAIAARSAVGSGDAFAAGMMVGLLRGEPISLAAALGAACGAANAITDLAGHLSPDDVDDLRKRVIVEPF